MGTTVGGVAGPATASLWVPAGVADAVTAAAAAVAAGDLVGSVSPPLSLPSSLMLNTPVLQGGPWVRLFCSQFFPGCIYMVKRENSFQILADVLDDSPGLLFLLRYCLQLLLLLLLQRLQ